VGWKWLFVRRGRATCAFAVTCPLALYTATSDAETSGFNLINRATGKKMKAVDARRR
jgi:non-homologous end joining protein Ku